MTIFDIPVEPAAVILVVAILVASACLWAYLPDFDPFEHARRDFERNHPRLFDQDSEPTNVRPIR